MKRLLPLGTAFVVVVTACGAGTKPAPRLAEVAARSQPSVRALAAARKGVAVHEAETLLRSVVRRPRATKLQHPPAHAGTLLSRGDLGIFLFAELAQRHAFWRVRAPFRSVVAFAKKHRPAGFVLGSEGRMSGTPRNAELYFDGRIPGGQPPRGLLSVVVVQLADRVVLRVDAGAAWIYPRSRHERVPAGVLEVDLTAPHVVRHVHGPAKVSRVVHWFDALHIVQPGAEAVSCPLALVPDVKLAFRGPSGAVLATSRGPGGSASACDPIEFSVYGHRQTPLIDSSGQPPFAARLQRLLGVRLVPRR